MSLQGEPSLEQIEDYNNNESPEKRKTVRLVVIGILIVGALYALVKYNFSTPSDYIGTPENPGINITKH